MWRRGGGYVSWIRTRKKKKKRKTTHLVFGALCVKHCHQHISVAIPACAVRAEYLTKSGRRRLRRLSDHLRRDRSADETNLFKHLPGGREKGLWGGRLSRVA